MRDARVWLLFGSIGIFLACDPGIRQFDASPDKLSCPGPTTLTWRGTGDAAHLDADHSVTPSLPAIVSKQGSRVEQVSTTTTFTFFYPGAGHREKTVEVTSAVCESNCGIKVLTFTGTCATNGGPSYIMLSLGAADAPGALQQLLSDANFPVHVLHAGAEIALGAAGGPILPLPNVPASGGYTITVPGQVGIDVCNGAGPTHSGGPAPIVHISVTPTCPKHVR